MDKNILLLSHTFPPAAMPEAILSAKTLGGLKNFGYKTDVICGEPISHGNSIDQSLIPYVTEHFSSRQYVRPAHFLGRQKYSAFFRKIFPGLYKLPDACRFTNLNILRAAREKCLKNYFAIVTWSQWHSIHLVGLQLKKDFPHLKWVAHLSDPWIENPYVPLSRLLKFFNERMQRQVFQFADWVTLTSDRSMDLILTHFSGAAREKLRTKFIVIPHPFDPDLYKPFYNQHLSQHQSGGSHMKVIRHLGHFYGHRKPDSFFQALKILISAQDSLIQEIRFEFFGNMAKESQKFLRSLELPPDLIEINKPVSYLESLQLASSADALLLIDAPATQSVFLPSKLIDYLGARKPILGITPAGTSRELVTRIGGVCVEPDNPQEIANALSRFIRRLSEFKPQTEIIKLFSVEAVANQMHGLFTVPSQQSPNSGRAI